MNDQKIAHAFRKKVRGFWHSIIESMENPEALMPPGIQDEHKAFGFCYYLALLQMAKEALDQMELEDAKASQDDPRKQEPTFLSRDGVDAKEMSKEEVDAQIRALNEQVRIGKLVHIDDVLMSSDAVFESMRIDMLTLPLAFTSVSARQISIDQIQEICAQELKVVATRLMDEMAQAIDAAIRQSQRRIL